MQIKEVQPINFLFFRKQTTVQELVQFLPVAQELYREAVDQNLRIAGPIHWHYHEFMDLAKPFTLEISLPVSEFPEGYDGRFHVKRTDIFRCISTMHEGGWNEIPLSYARIMEYAGANQLTPKGTNREIYINVDFTSPEANVTEVQLGIV